jgi:hypothetical protein
MSSPSETRVTSAGLRRRFQSHLARNARIAAAVLIASLAIGMAGYHWLAPMPWLDAFVNAAMLLGGMGPVDALSNASVKLFAGFYALYCGVVFIASVGLLLTPVASHVLHRFHLSQNR